MANVQHYKKSDIKRLTNEFEREKECNNLDGRINPKKTSENYTMIPRRTHYELATKVDLRLNHVVHSNRKDLNVISGWVITCPQELLNDPKKQKQFFEKTFEFCQNRYGIDNVLNGYVHMDEKTPHMHVPVVPVSAKGRVSSKEVFTRTELSKFHKDLDDLMYKEFGQKNLILTGRTKGNYTVQELKARTRDEEALALKYNNLDVKTSDLDKREKALDERELTINHKHKVLDEREKRLEDDRAIFNDSKQNYMDKLQKSFIEANRLSKLCAEKLDKIELADYCQSLKYKDGTTALDKYLEFRQNPMNANKSLLTYCSNRKNKAGVSIRDKFLEYKAHQPKEKISKNNIPIEFQDMLKQSEPQDSDTDNFDY